MLAVARRRAREAGVHVEFATGDAHRLDFPDQSFDTVVCLRVLMHTPDWHQSLTELCRVAKHHVVFDYPALVSAAALQSASRRLAASVGARVESYRVFTERSIQKALSANGFRVADAHRQFALPIALHKRFNSAAMTARVEGVLARAGLTRFIGSPVTVVAERCAF